MLMSIRFAWRPLRFAVRPVALLNAARRCSLAPLRNLASLQLVQPRQRQSCNRGHQRVRLMKMQCAGAGTAVAGMAGMAGSVDVLHDDRAATSNARGGEDGMLPRGQPRHIVESRSAAVVRSCDPHQDGAAVESRRFEAQENGLVRHGRLRRAQEQLHELHVPMRVGLHHAAAFKISVPGCTSWEQ